MPRGRDLIGLSVLVGPMLKCIGPVKEILLATDPMCICGLVLGSRGWFQPERIIDFRAVRIAGPTHVLAEERYLNKASSSRCCQDLLGLPVLHASGEDLGMLDDVHFSMPGGKVVAVQLSQGLVDDLWNGKRLLHLTGPVQMGEAAILLHPRGRQVGGAVH